MIFKRYTIKLNTNVIEKYLLKHLICISLVLDQNDIFKSRIGCSYIFVLNQYEYKMCTFYKYRYMLIAFEFGICTFTIYPLPR